MTEDRGVVWIALEEDCRILWVGVHFQDYWLPTTRKNIMVTLGEFKATLEASAEAYKDAQRALAGLNR